MDKIKKYKATNVNPEIETRSLLQMSAKTNNLYEALSIIGKRSNQIGGELKTELHAKLEEFATSTDNLEEVFENREQIEISKYYERLPHPTLLAVQEFMTDAIYHRYKEDQVKKDASE